MPARVEGGRVQSFKGPSTLFITYIHSPARSIALFIPAKDLQRLPWKEMIRLAALVSFGRPQQQPINLRLTDALLMLLRHQHAGQREKF